MGKYMFIYRGPVTPTDQVTEEEAARGMAEWLAWEARVGSALVDDGAPFGARACVHDDGSVAPPAQLQGYGIVETRSLEDAVALAARHPFLSDNEGSRSVDVFELVDLDTEH